MTAASVVTQMIVDAAAMCHSFSVEISTHCPTRVGFQLLTAVLCSSTYRWWHGVVVTRWS